MSFQSWARRLAAAVAFGALCTCGTLDRFDVETGAQATIAKATLVDKLIGALDFSEFEEIDFSQDIANQGVREDQIDSVKMKTFVLRTDDPSATLDFIESVEFYAEAEGLPRVLVASSSDLAGQSSVELDLTDEELKPYVVAPYMTIGAEVVGERPDEDTTIIAEVTLAVDATIPGCE